MRKFEWDEIEKALQKGKRGKAVPEGRVGKEVWQLAMEEGGWAARRVREAWDNAVRGRVPARWKGAPRRP